MEFIDEVKHILKDEYSGHDWLHTKNVYHNALDLWKYYPETNIDIIRYASLTHDIADHKFGYTDVDRKNIITELLTKYNVEYQVIFEVIKIVNQISFSKKVDSSELSLEAKIVQDADRLDALGAIGIARTFAFGGVRGRPIYDEDYQEGNQDTIQHFYDKLLLLQDKMNTKQGREIAEERTRYMIQFLERFYQECNIEEQR